MLQRDTRGGPCYREHMVLSNIWKCISSFSWSLIYTDVSLNGNTFERETNGSMNVKDSFYSFSIKNIFYDKMDLRFFYFHVTNARIYYASWRIHYTSLPYPVAKKFLSKPVHCISLNFWFWNFLKSLQNNLTEKKLFDTLSL